MRGYLERLLAIQGHLYKHSAQDEEGSPSCLLLPSHSTLEPCAPSGFPILGEMSQVRVCAEEDDQDSIGSRVHINMNSSWSWGPGEVNERDPS